MEYTVQNLEYAVSVFYNCEHSERTQAHQWLTAAQSCPEAWSFVWELLQTNKGTEVQFFAATTLHTKILRCWNELPPESHEELKNKILQTVFAYSKGPKIVLNRLCISLAAYIMQQKSQDLATILRPLSSIENKHLLLEVLTVIPEEFNSMTMGSVMRTKNRTALQQACPAVLDDMLGHLQSVYSKEPVTTEKIELWNTVATCAASWLALGGDESSVREYGTCTMNLAECLPLCHALLHIVHLLYTWNETVSDSALEACEAALGAVRTAGASPDAASYPTAALQLLSALAALMRPLLAKDNVPNSPNEELLASILTCAVALGESHTQALVKAIEQPAPHEGAREFLEHLLVSQAAPGHFPVHETRSQLLFGFWYTLQDAVLCLYDNSKNVNEMWRVVFTRLLNILIVKSEAPSDDSMTQDDAELLRCYRQDIADTVMYCYGVLGEWCWSVAEAAWEAAGAGEGEGARREAALHVALALADAAPAPSQRAPPALPRLLRRAVAAAAGSAHPRLLATALECLGAYAIWINSLEGADREEGALLARAALQAAGAAFPRAPPAAALALKKLSTECSAHAAPLARDITIAAQSESARGDAWVRRQLLGAAAAALSASPHDVAAPLLRELATSLAKDLQEESLNANYRRGAAEAAAAFITPFASNPVLAAELLRIVLPTLPPYAHNELLVPSLFQLLKQAVSVLMDDCLPFLDDISELTLQALNTLACPSGIDFVKLLVLMFGSQWSGSARLLRAGAAAAAAAAAAPDAAEALFAALQAVTKKKPQYIDQLDEMLPRLVQLGCDRVRAWEGGAARAAVGWLAALAAARPRALRPAAPALTATALACIGGATPRNQVETFAELLLAMNRAQWGDAADGDLGLWLRSALAQRDFPTVHASNQHKQKFISAVIKEKNNRRRLLEYIQEFSLVCRGLVGTEYGKQTLATKLMIA